MAFSIDPQKLFAIGLRTDGGKFNLRGDGVDPGKSIREKLNEPVTKSQSPDLSTLAQQPPPNVDSRTVSNIKNIIDTADRALTAVGDLRKRQRNLAREAELNPEVTARDATANTEISNLQSEINRISANGTVNNINVVSSGATVELHDNQPSDVNSNTPSVNVNSAIGVASSASVVADLGISITSATTASSAVSTLDDAVIMTSQLSGAAQNAAEKASALTPANPSTAVSAALPVKDGIQNIDDALKLANSIANKLGSPFNTQEVKRDLIEASTGNLQPDRVRDLLS